MEQILHYPDPRTVLIVEEVLKEAELAITREELKKRLSHPSYASNTQRSSRIS